MASGVSRRAEQSLFGQGNVKQSVFPFSEIPLRFFSSNLNFSAPIGQIYLTPR